MMIKVKKKSLFQSEVWTFIFLIHILNTVGPTFIISVVPITKWSYVGHHVDGNAIQCRNGNVKFILLFAVLYNTCMLYGGKLIMPLFRTWSQFSLKWEWFEIKSTLSWSGMGPTFEVKSFFFKMLIWSRRGGAHTRRHKVISCHLQHKLISLYCVGLLFDFLEIGRLWWSDLGQSLAIFHEWWWWGLDLDCPDLLLFQARCMVCRSFDDLWSTSL